MAVKIKMPKLGMSENDMQVVKWYKQEGENVNQGECLAEVEGDKITNDIESPEKGKIHKILVLEGDVVPIGTTLAILGEADEDISDLLLSEVTVNQPAKSPELSETSKDIEFTTKNGRSQELEGNAIKASPVAKKLAKEHNINLFDIALEVPPGKRIQGDDVKAYMDKLKSPKKPSSKPNLTEIKLVGMRRTIAERMSLSSRETAPVVLMRSVDITKLRQLREDMKEQFKAEEIRVPSFNDFVMKAVALALEEHPRLNSTFEGDRILMYQDINLNVAIAVEDGLITPVIRNTNKLTVWEISEQIRKLAERANAGSLEAEDLQDGTFTVTNLGMKGIEVSTPIINPPQVAILAVGTIRPYLVMEEGEIFQRYKTFLSLTLDHRIVDGAPGADYLQTLSKYFQAPMLLMK